MSKYTQKPIDFAGLKTISVFARGGKVRVEDFAQVYEKGGGIAALVDSLPRILAADFFRAVVVATGTPEEVVKIKNSYTAQALENRA